MAIAQDPDILGRFVAALQGGGVVGEERAARLLYLAVTSRLLDRPVSVAVKGPSSGGKSFLVGEVLKFFPENAYYALSTMSEKALAYSEEALAHRMLVLFETAGLNGAFSEYLLRTLLSEGRLRYETVEKTKDGLRPRLIERDGPTGLIVTTTLARLHPENETRLLTVTVNDSPAQSRAVLRALARAARTSGPPERGRSDGTSGRVDVRPWHALQEWLANGERRVVVPFATRLAELIPPVAVRLRRDFQAVITLIKAHALLHQANRDIDANGAVVATVVDYAAVRDLVAGLVSEGVDASVPPAVRETVEAVAFLPGLDAEGGTGVSIKAIARKLGLDQSAAWRRVQVAITAGYLRNLETRPRQPARIVLGEPMPDEYEILPAPERLQVCMEGGEDTALPPRRAIKLHSSAAGAVRSCWHSRRQNRGQPIAGGGVRSVATSRTIPPVVDPADRHLVPAVPSPVRSRQGAWGRGGSGSGCGLADGRQE